MNYFFVLILVVVSADYEWMDSNIFNGETASEGQFPYHVYLQILTNYNPDLVNPRCGGSLISETFILTAAHCLDYSIDKIFAYLGGIYELSGIRREIRNITIHPDWANDPNVSLQNDIGLAEIDYVSYTYNIQSIGLPAISSSYPSYERNIVVLSGFGNYDESLVFSRTLQYALLFVISNKACATFWQAWPEIIPADGEIITDSVLCAAAPNQASACHGDSGSPLVHVYSNLLIGIGSLVPPVTCSFGNLESGFTRVTSYRQWIYENTGI